MAMIWRKPTGIGQAKPSICKKKQLCCIMPKTCSEIPMGNWNLFAFYLNLNQSITVKIS
jgi:hypothetical protein